MNALIPQAVELLKKGDLVAFPTETVYGLGADALNSQAVEKIFKAKGRPSNNPLIVHIASAQIAQRYCTHWPKNAQILADAFWPGPLTLVLPKIPQIPDIVTANLPSVGLRVPKHPLALELLKAFDGPIAAPSANRSNRISPTTAAHVHKELGNRIKLVLDGGPCVVGIESTVLDLTKQPTLLRPGQITLEQIQALIGQVNTIKPKEHLPSPGQLPVHYSPTTPAYRFAKQTHLHLPPFKTPCAILHYSPIAIPLGGISYAMPSNPDDYAQKLYDALHDADQKSLAAIYIEFPPDQPEWRAVIDRITRATIAIENK